MLNLFYKFQNIEFNFYLLLNFAKFIKISLKVRLNLWILREFERKIGLNLARQI